MKVKASPGILDDYLSRIQTATELKVCLRTFAGWRKTATPRRT